MEDLADRIRALIAQALAEAESRPGTQVRALHIVLYETDPDLRDALVLTFEWASRDTVVQNAQLLFKQAPGRFACWNCCGLRYDAEDGVCPNCGDVGLIIPPEVAFGLEKVELVA